MESTREQILGYLTKAQAIQREYLEHIVYIDTTYVETNNVRRVSFSVYVFNDMKEDEHAKILAKCYINEWEDKEKNKEAFEAFIKDVKNLGLEEDLINLITTKNYE